METQKILNGKSIVVTRPEEQSTSFCSQLVHEGAKPICFPVIKTQKITRDDDLKRIKKVLNQIRKYRWILFTSVNGVKYFLSFFKELKDISKYKIRIGAIGTETAKALETNGLAVTLCPREFRAEALLSELIENDEAALSKGARVLIPRAREARSELPQGLAEIGAHVDVIPIYETVISDDPIDDLLAKLETREIDCVTFTSSSTVKFFFEKFKAHDMSSLLRGVVTACIGPITAETLGMKKITPDIIACVYTTQGIIQALHDFYQEKNCHGV